MEYTTENNKTTVYLTGKITASNAPELEDKIVAILSQTAATSVELSAASLEYISSAGLRVVMRLLKRLNEVSIIDANQEVYDVFEMTGLTEVMRVGRRARQVSVEGCEFIGAGGFGKVYRTDPETIVKVYAPTCTRDFVEKEREQARSTFVMGVPTAIPYDLVRVDDSWGLVFELLDADTVAHVIDQDPSRVEECARILGDLLKELHAIEVPEGRLPNRADVLRGWYTNVMGPYLEPEETKAIVDYLDSIPRSTTFLHGDYHAKNVMLRDGEPLLIDVGDAAVGNPIFDLAQMGLCYIMLAGAIRAGRRPQSLLGYDVDLAEPMWRGQIARYLGNDDEAEFQAFQAKITPLMYLLATYGGAQIQGNDPEHLKNMVASLVRARTIPAILNASPASL